MKSLYDGNFACVVFIDLQKSYYLENTLGQSILLSKLCHYGTHGLANKWFESYLANRK